MTYMDNLKDLSSIDELDTLDDVYERMNTLWDCIIAIKELAKKIDANHLWLLAEVEDLQERYE